MTKIPPSRALQHIGLTPNEVRVYLASIALGSAPVIALAHEARIKRTTVYHALETLQRRGLMRTEVVGLKKYYAPESPEQLYAIVDVRRNELEAVFPELEAQYSATKAKSTIKRYEGLEGIKVMYNTLLNALQRGEEYLAVSDAQAWKRVDPVWFQDFVERRSKICSRSKILLRDNEMGRWYKKYERNFGLEVKLFSSEHTMHANFAVAGEYTVFQQLVAPLYGTLLVDKGVAEMQKEMFRMLWEKC